MYAAVNTKSSATQKLDFLRSRQLGCYSFLVIKTNNKNAYKWFQNLQSGSRSRRGDGFNRGNIFNISSIESLGPTQKLALRGGFETTSNQEFQTPKLRIEIN
jgi:hypothetical protein